MQSGVVCETLYTARERGTEVPTRRVYVVHVRNELTQSLRHADAATRFPIQSLPRMMYSLADSLNVVSLMACSNFCVWVRRLRDGGGDNARDGAA